MAMLTSGAIPAMLNKRKIPRPILQVIRITEVNRLQQYRIALSDGHNRTSNAFLSPRLNRMVTDECLVPNDIVVLTRYSCRSTPFIVVFDLCVVIHGGPERSKLELPLNINNQCAGPEKTSAGHEGPAKEIENVSYPVDIRPKSCDDLQSEDEVKSDYIKTERSEEEEQYSDNSSVDTHSLLSSESDVTYIYTSDTHVLDINANKAYWECEENKATSNLVPWAAQTITIMSDTGICSQEHDESSHSNLATCLINHGGPERSKLDLPSKINDQCARSEQTSEGDKEPTKEIESVSYYVDIKSCDDVESEDSDGQNTECFVYGVKSDDIKTESSEEEELYSDNSSDDTQSLLSSESDVTYIYTSDTHALDINANNEYLECGENKDVSTSNLVPWAAQIIKPMSKTGVCSQEHNENSHSKCAVSLINQLHSNSSRHWVILARVTRKTDVRHWKYRGKPGYSFSVLLQDSSGEIRATAFCKQVDDFNELLVLNGVYHFSNVQVKKANQRYNNADNEYEIRFSDATGIKLYDGAGDFDVPKQELNPAMGALSSLFNCKSGDKVHIIGIVRLVKECTTGRTRDGRDYVKRDIILVDDSCTQCILTIWDDDCLNLNDLLHPVVAATHCTVNNWHGGSISTTRFESNVFVNPEMPETSRLQQWFHQMGDLTNFREFSLPHAQKWFRCQVKN